MLLYHSTYHYIQNTHQMPVESARLCGVILLGTDYSIRLGILRDIVVDRYLRCSPLITTVQELAALLLFGCSLALHTRLLRSLHIFR